MLRIGKPFSPLVEAVALLTLASLVFDTIHPGFGPAAHAAEAPSQKPIKTRVVPTITERIYKSLAEAQAAVDAKKLDAALAILNALSMTGLNGNEKGQIYNMLGYVYFSKENYPKTIYNYEQVLAQGEHIPVGLEVGTLYSLAQLYFVTNKYQQSLDYMRKWLAQATNPGPEPHVFMGQVYYQMKDYPKAIVEIENGVNIAKQRGMPVKENWWQLLRYLYFENENWPKVIDVLETLVIEFPKREYWLQLAGAYGQAGDTKRQLNVMEAADIGKFLTREADVMSYAGLLMQEELPNRAGLRIAKGMADNVVESTAKNLEWLGQAWQMAQEVDKAIVVFQAAAQKSDNGEIYSRLAQLYLDKNDFEKCVETANSALDKGHLRKPQATYVVRGMCLFNANRLGDARKSFDEGSRAAHSAADASNEHTCQQWINYIDKEKIRRDAIDASI